MSNLSSPSCWHLISVLWLSKPSLVFAVHLSLRSSYGCASEIASYQKAGSCWKPEAVGKIWKQSESTHCSLCNCPCCWQECGCEVCVLNACGPCPAVGVMKKSSKGTGSAFWQLVVRQESWDLLQKEPGPAAAAAGGRCWGALLLRPLCWSLGPAAEWWGSSRMRRCM